MAEAAEHQHHLYLPLPLHHYGQRLYESSVASLPHDDGCEPKGLCKFVHGLKDQAVASNWEPTLQIPQDGNVYNLLDHYGQLTVSSIRAHAETYI